MLFWFAAQYFISIHIERETNQELNRITGLAFNISYIIILRHINRSHMMFQTKQQHDDPFNIDFDGENIEFFFFI